MLLISFSYLVYESSRKQAMIILNVLSFLATGWGRALFSGDRREQSGLVRSAFFLKACPHFIISWIPLCNA